MKHIIKYLIIIITMNSLLFSLKESQNEEYEKLVTRITQKIIEKWQYSPKEVDDIYSILVYDVFMDRMDFDRKYFLTDEIFVFDQWREKLDDLIYDYEPEFFNLYIDTWKTRIGEIKYFLNNIKIDELNFNKNEFLEINPDKRDYFETKELLLEDWRKRFKFQILRKYWSLAEEDSTLNISDFNGKLNKEILSKAYEKELKNSNRRFDRLISQDRNELYSVFINAYTQTFDPHTSYFMPSRKEDFDINISGRLEGIGARLREDDGYIKVVDIIPGGAAWRQGELKIDDLIIEVAQEGEEPVNIVEWRSRDAVKLIRGKKDTEVRLTVNRADGSSHVIPIIRDIIIIEDTYSKSMLLEHKLVDHKIGYITLPKFYHDFKNEGGRNSADDIRNDLIRLNEAEVEGLIFDLRNNGGGALDDVVKMGGFFIEDGPIVQVNGRNNRKRILKDKDSNIVFDKPVVFIVNQYSASASEILASAMQDYKRAIIVGSEQTFGKGTVQRFINMDQFLTKNETDYSPIGSLKLTIQKFYRINGESTQYKGVIPDIVLPFKNDYKEIGERALDNYLDWDTISEANYNELERNNESVNYLVENSNNRIANNSFFQEIISRKLVLEEKNNNSLISINQNDFIIRALKEKNESEEFNDLIDEFKEFDLIDIVSFNDLDKLDKVELEKEIKFQDKLKKDFYLNETIFVLNDLIEQLSKSN
ncbi:MAG: carboxy terminal-processing peptidase [Candidatus Marinimicrobia bacterium]|nr:carboxy terminal-processing peptidase [Candidatus Neomarinimicrobiota bacterium]